MATATGADIALSILVYPEAGRWVAQCLEFDVVASGDSLDEAVHLFGVTLAADFAEARSRGLHISSVGAAPERFHQRWTAARPGGEGS